MASTILIEYDGTDITDSCIFSECSFESQMAAIPGQFTVLVRDMAQTHSFVTGRELTLTVDGQLLYGGYVLQVTKKYAFEADNTLNPDSTAVLSRQWLLIGVDWNILLDKRVLRNPANYTHDIPKVTGSHTDAYIIRTWFTTYFDIPAGFNFTSSADILDCFLYTDGFTWDTQGTTMRLVLEKLGYWGGVYWISADKQLHFMPVQDVVAPWGFSDVPNHTTRIGFRDGDFTQDASAVINDALVWGGSEWTANGDVVFARRKDAVSVAAHGDWQLGEVRLGELKSQGMVNARAKVIVDGSESGIFRTGSKGLINPESQFRCTWFAHDVPSSHLLPGQVTPIELWVFSADGGATPFTTDLPLRSMTISFPGLDANGDAYVQFEGFFGVLMSDPFWLWDFLRAQAGARQQTGVTYANDNSVNPPYGAKYIGYATIAGGFPADGSDRVFYVAGAAADGPWGYIAGSLKVYLNGIPQQISVVYWESDPPSGVFTFVTAPHVGDVVRVEAVLTG